MNFSMPREDQPLSGFYSHPPEAGNPPPALLFKRAALFLSWKAIARTVKGLIPIPLAF